MSFEWLDTFAGAAGWLRVAIDRSIDDRFQIYVFISSQ
jgi:hypothetical protein